MTRIVITGGVYSGKTSLVNALQVFGYRAVPEAEMIIVNELRKDKTQEEWKEWLLNNYTEFMYRVAEKKQELEENLPPSKKPTVLDRGFIDCIAWCRLRGIEVPRPILDTALTSLYDLVLICRTFDNFDQRTNTGRIITKKEAIRLGDLTKEAYEEYDHFTVEVPPGSGSYRAGFVMEQHLLHKA